MATKSDLAINLQGIVQRYNRSYVLRGINLQLEQGKLLALYGGNGSGKSTLLRIIATAITPTRGSGQILGFDLKEKQLIRAKCLLISHSLGLYSDLTASENLFFCGKMYNKTKTNDEIKTLLDKVGLQISDTRVRSFSSGMRKRLALAKMLLIEPEIALLDEPLAALDPNGKKLVLEILQTHQKNTTLIVASHEPDVIGQIAKRQVILKDGKLAEVI